MKKDTAVNDGGIPAQKGTELTGPRGENLPDPRQPGADTDWKSIGGREEDSTPSQVNTTIGQDTPMVKTGVKTGQAP